MPATRWSSHKDLAAKALRKLAGPHVPASLTQARAGGQARPHRLRQGRDRGARAQRAERPPDDRARRRRWSTTSSTRPRSRRRPLAGRPATRGWHALTGARVAGDRPASGAGPSPKEPTWPAASAASRSPTEAARRAPPGRPRTHRAGRPRAADQRRLAALDQGPRQQRPLPLQPRKPDADRRRLPRPRHHPDLRSRLPRLPAAQPLRAQGREGDPHPRPGRRQAARRAGRGDRREEAVLPDRAGLRRQR